MNRECNIILSARVHWYISWSLSGKIEPLQYHWNEEINRGIKVYINVEGAWEIKAGGNKGWSHWWLHPVEKLGWADSLRSLRNRCFWSHDPEEGSCRDMVETHDGSLPCLLRAWLHFMPSVKVPLISCFRDRTTQRKVFGGNVVSSLGRKWWGCCLGKRHLRSPGYILCGDVLALLG